MRLSASKREVLHAGMTLIELLVVVAIIGVLVTLVLPAVQAARETTRRAQCQSNLRQIGFALHVYHDSRRQLPIGCVDKRTATNPAGRQLAWSATILPQLEQTALWGEIDFAKGYDSGANSVAARQVVEVYLCPTTVRYARRREGAWVEGPPAPGGAAYRAAAIDYGGMYGAANVSPPANGVMLYDRAVKISDVTDGISHTLAVAEDSGRGWANIPQHGEWINGENIFDVAGPINRQQDNEVWSDHPAGAMALWCDGSVTFLEETIELPVLLAISTRAGHEYSDDVR